MCGIFGVVTDDQDVLALSKAAASSLVASMIHRGPDDQRIAGFPQALLGMVRLSIIDTEHGQQPIYSHCGRYVLVFNGEIYNYVELRAQLAPRIPFLTHSDSEVIMRAFELDGLEAVKSFNGMFAVALYDLQEKKLLLCRDRAGEKPLYYWLSPNGKTCAFASEIKTLHSLPFIPKELDPSALVGLLKFNYVPGHATIFRNILQLPPAHSMAFVSGGATKLSSFWDLNHLTRSPASDFRLSDWTDEFYEIFDDAVAIRLRSDVPLAAFLSSGTDSNAVVWTAKRRLNQDIKAITVGFAEADYDESAVAVQSAADLGIPIARFLNGESSLDKLWKVHYYLDQPHGDASFIPMYELCEKAAESVKVVLTGDGSDEIFGGYSKYFGFAQGLQTGLSEDEALYSYYEKSSVFGDRDVIELVGEKAKIYLDEHYAAFAQSYGRYDFLDPANKLLFAEFEFLLQGNNLIKPDRMGMAHSIELRAPFLDHRLIEHSFAMPGSSKFNTEQTKIGLRQALTRLLPDYLISRKKMALTVPVGEWYCTHLRDFVRERLGPSNPLFANGILKFEFVSRIVEEHLSRRCNRTREIRLLLALSTWIDVSEVL